MNEEWVSACHLISAVWLEPRQMLDSKHIDIALLSEHKLLPRSATFMDTIHPNYASIVTIDRSIEAFTTYRCGKAGTAIMVKHSLQKNVQRLNNIENDRIVGIEISSDQFLPMLHLNRGNSMTC